MSERISAAGSSPSHMVQTTIVLPAYSRQHYHSFVTCDDVPTGGMLSPRAGGRAKRTTPSRSRSIERCG
jgi:hypothetical protein